MTKEVIAYYSNQKTHVQDQQNSNPPPATRALIGGRSMKILYSPSQPDYSVEQWEAKPADQLHSEQSASPLVVSTPSIIDYLINIIVSSTEGTTEDEDTIVHAQS